MKKKSVFFLLLLILTIVFFVSSYAYAFWIWTPQTNRWINPKHAAKDTPQKQFDYTMGFYKRGDYKKAAQEFEKLIDSYPGSSLAPDAGYYGGLSYQKCEEYYAAYLVYNKILTQYPHSKRISQIVEEEYKIGKIFLTGKKRKVMGIELLPALSTSEEIFKSIVDNAPYSSYGDKAQFQLGQVYKEKHQYAEATAAFEKILKDYPDSSLKDKAQYEIALCSLKSSLPAEYEQGTTEKAIRKFKEFIEEKPPKELTREAQQTIDKLKDKKAKHDYDIAQFYEQNKKYKSATIYYKSIIKDYPKTQWAKKAEEKLKEIDKKQKGNEK